MTEFSIRVLITKIRSNVYFNYPVTFTGSVVFDGRYSLISLINRLHVNALKNEAESQYLLDEIRGIWYLQPGYGFHICKDYGPGDIKAPLSTLAVIMSSRSSIFECCKDFIESNYGRIEYWLSRTTISSRQEVTESLNLQIRGLINDQIMLKSSSLRILELCAEEIMIHSYISSRQVLGSKLNTCDLFTRKISKYIYDFVFARRVCKSLQLCKRLFFSTEDIIKHVVEISEILNGI